MVLLEERLAAPRRTLIQGREDPSVLAWRLLVGRPCCQRQPASSLSSWTASMAIYGELTPLHCEILRMLLSTFYSAVLISGP